MMKPTWISVGLVVACVIVVLLVATYNKPADERIVALAQQSLDTQSRQNESMIEQNKQVAEASKELVAADAQARREMAQLSREMQAERATIGRQRDGLEAERRQIAAQRHRDIIFAAALNSAALIAACLLPLLLAWAVLRAVNSGSADDRVIADLLLEDAASEQPKLLPYGPLPNVLPGKAADDDHQT